VLAFKIRPIRSLEEDIVSRTSIIWRVILISYSGINHHDIVLLMVMQMVHNVLHPRQGKSLWVKCEDFAEVHVVNIGPHGLERDVCLAVVGDNFCQHEIVLIAVFALVKLRRTPNPQYGIITGVRYWPSAAVLMIFKSIPFKLRTKTP
jgi:hypothetical protein